MHITLTHISFIFESIVAAVTHTMEMSSSLATVGTVRLAAIF